MWEMYSPFGEHYWDREYEEKKRIINDNYDKIVEHYELQIMTDKLTEIEPKYNVNFKNFHDWEVICNNEFRFYCYNGELNVAINLQCFLEEWKLSQYINQIDFTNILKTYLTSEIKNLFINVPFNIIIKDITCMIKPVFDRLGLNIVFKIVLLINDEYFITIENLKILEEKISLIKKIINKEIQKLYHQIRRDKYGD